VSKRLDPVLPDRLFRLLDGEHLDEQIGKAIMLVTIDDQEMPYPAMLSFLETVAVDRKNIRIAPWNNSTTTKNLRERAKASLLIVDEGLACYIQGIATELERDLKGFAGMAKINLRIESILEDNALAYEGSARMTSGLRYENPQMDAAYIRRARQVLEALKQ
jgi:hypothetical protein